MNTAAAVASCPVQRKQHTAPDPLRGIRGIIFDFDGTLYDNILLPFRVIAPYPPDILRIRGERLIRKRFAGCDYNSAEEYNQAFFSALGKVCRCSPQKIQNWYVNRYMPRFVRVLKKYYQPRPGAKELLECFTNSMAKENPASNQIRIPKVAVYSDYPLIQERLEALGINTRGLLLYEPDSFGAQKPAPRPFRQIAKDLGAAPEEVLVIGDRDETDGLGAFNAGMRYFCVETGHKRHFRLDPNRRLTTDEYPAGPALLMYGGSWEQLVTLLSAQFFPA